MSSVPPIAKATIQAAATNAGSNVLAQGIRAVRDGVSGLAWLIPSSVFVFYSGRGELIDPILETVYLGSTDVAPVHDLRVDRVAADVPLVGRIGILPPGE